MKDDNRPEHQKIAAYYRALIMSGDMKPGAKLPTVQELMGRWGVALNTIQRMQEVLRAEGFTETRRGVGVYVRSRSLVVTEATEYLPLTNQILAVAEVPAPADVAEEFKLESGALVAMRRRILLRDGEPFELATSYYPLAIARGTGLQSTGKVRGGTPALFRRLGYETVEIVDKLSARLPTTEEFELLELPDDIPVVRTFRVLYAANRTPFDVSILIKGGHLYELQYQLPPG